MHLSRRAFIAASLSSPAALPALEAGSQQAARAVPAPDKSSLHYLSVVEAGELIRTRRISPVELTEAVLRRIDAVESKLRAFITVTREVAMDAARQAEKEIAAGKYRGPLHGIPFGVKDTHYTQGIKTTAGSGVLDDFLPSFDATVVARLKQAGAVLVGKTNLPEFSMGGNTPSFNPWDATRTPGGSSGGSAVALAAGMLVAATGGDTSNSIRHPATLCNVVGMKATYGRVSRHGIVAISWSLDHVGPMTRTVEDNAVMLNLLAGYDPLDETSSDVPVPDYTRTLRGGVKGLRVAIPQDALIDDFHPDCQRAFRDAIEVFARLGAKVMAVDMPPTLEAMDEGQRIIRIAEAASYHSPLLARRADRYGPDTVVGSRPRRDVEAGHLVTAAQYLRALRLRKLYVRQKSELFKTFDVFITPGRPAPAGEQARVKQDFARMFDTSGFPCMAVPAGFSVSPAGLPVGLQIAAGPFEEAMIYRAAYAYQEATHWEKRRPPI